MGSQSHCTGCYSTHAVRNGVSARPCDATQHSAAYTHGVLQRGTYGGAGSCLDHDSMVSIRKIQRVSE